MCQVVIRGVRCSLNDLYLSQLITALNSAHLCINNFTRVMNFYYYMIVFSVDKSPVCPCASRVFLFNLYLVLFVFIKSCFFKRHYLMVLARRVRTVSVIVLSLIYYITLCILIIVIMYKVSLSSTDTIQLSVNYIFFHFPI